MESGGSRCVCIIACNFWPPCCECHLMSATLPQSSSLAVQGPRGEGGRGGGAGMAVEQRFTIFIGIPCILVSLMWVSFRVSFCLSIPFCLPILALPCPTRDLHANSGETKQENANEKIEGNSCAISVNKYPVHTHTHIAHSPGTHTRLSTHATVCIFGRIRANANTNSKAAQQTPLSPSHTALPWSTAPASSVSRRATLLLSSLTIMSS